MSFASTVERKKPDFLEKPGFSRTLLVGLGNPILGDDGVGWRVVEAVESQLSGAPVDVAYLSLGGLSLMEHSSGMNEWLSSIRFRCRAVQSEMCIRFRWKRCPIRQLVTRRRHMTRLCRPRW